MTTDRGKPGTPEKADRNQELTEARIREGLTYLELGDRYGIHPARAARIVGRRAKRETDYRRRLEAAGLWPPRQGRRPKREES